MSIEQSVGTRQNDQKNTFWSSLTEVEWKRVHAEMERALPPRTCKALKADLLNDASERLLRSKLPEKGFRAPDGHIPYAKKAVRNCLTDHLRRLAPRGGTPVSWDGHQPSDGQGDRTDGSICACLAQFIDDLTDIEAMVLLAGSDGKSIEEVAAEIGISKHEAYKCRRRLQARLKEIAYGEQLSREEFQRIQPSKKAEKHLKRPIRRAKKARKELWGRLMKMATGAMLLCLIICGAPTLFQQMQADSARTRATSPIVALASDDDPQQILDTEDFHEKTKGTPTVQHSIVADPNFSRALSIVLRGKEKGKKWHEHPIPFTTQENFHDDDGDDIRRLITACRSSAPYHGTDEAKRRLSDALVLSRCLRSELPVPGALRRGDDEARSRTVAPASDVSRDDELSHEELWAVVVKMACRAAPNIDEDKQSQNRKELRVLKRSKSWERKISPPQNAQMFTNKGTTLKNNIHGDDDGDGDGEGEYNDDDEVIVPIRNSERSKARCAEVLMLMQRSLATAATYKRLDAKAVARRPTITSVRVTASMRP